MSQIVMRNSTGEPLTPETDKMIVYGIGDHLYLKDSTGASRVLDGIGQAYTTTSYTAGTTLYTTNTPQHMASVRIWVVIDAYTVNAEMRMVTAVGSGSVTLKSAFTNPHSAGALVIYTDSSVVNAKWFGAKGDGVTDDAAAINAALAVDLDIVPGGFYKGTSVYLPAGNYLVLSPINLCNTTGVKLFGDDWWGTFITGRTNGYAVIECVGSGEIQLEDFHIYGDNTLNPACGIFTGRSTLNTNSAVIRAKRVYIRGYFTKAGWYAISSESNVLFDVVSQIYGGTTASADYVSYLNNDMSIPLMYATLSGVTGGYGLTMHRCTATGSGNHMCLHIKGTSTGLIEQSYFYTAGNDMIVIEGNCNSWTFLNMAMEYGTGAGRAAYYVKTGAVLNGFKWINSGAPGNITYYMNCETNSTIRAANWIGSFAAVPSILHHVEGCDFGLTSYDSTATDITINGNFFATRAFRGLNDTITAVGADSGNIIFQNSSSAAIHNALNLRNTTLTFGPTPTTGIRNFVSRSTAWQPGTIANDAMALITVTLPGVTTDGNYVTMASYTAISGGNWNISSLPAGSAVRVMIHNKSGASQSPTGILRVAAFQIVDEVALSRSTSDSVTVSEAVTLSIV